MDGERVADRIDEVEPGSEVLVERRAGHAGAIGDLLDRALVVGALDQQLPHRSHDARRGSPRPCACTRRGRYARFVDIDEQSRQHVYFSLGSTHSLDTVSENSIGEEREMPKASKETAPRAEDMGVMGGSLREVGGYTVAFETSARTQNGTPLFRGLPGDRCQSPHLGLRRGRLAHVPLRRSR